MNVISMNGGKIRRPAKKSFIDNLFRERFEAQNSKQ